MPHLVVTLVRGVPERGSGRLLLVRHHAQQLLNLEAGADTGAAVADTLRNKIYRFFARICVLAVGGSPGIRERWSCVILAAATYAA